MALIVHKYGGTSMGSTERIKNVAKRVAKWARAGHQMVVVPSAMSGETNRLLGLAKELAPREFTLLLSVPGIGENLGLTLLHEIGDIQRFPTVKDFLSYCRLVKGTVASAGKIKGLRGARLGNPYLRWAFGEAAIIAKRDHTVIGPLAQRLEKQMGGNKFKANTVVAIKLARAVYFMLKNKTVFDPDRLVASLSRDPQHGLWALSAVNRTA